MPLTIQEHFKNQSNRCLLIVIGSSPLNEQDCCEKLLYYGSIKKIQMTPNLLAAFVDFECPHAPLLVARCYEYYKKRLRVCLQSGKDRTEEVPMPKHVSTILPGCSMHNFLYLMHVPVALPSMALHRFFAQLSSHEVVVHRPSDRPSLGTPTKMSSRVVIELRVPANTIHQGIFQLIRLPVGISTCYAIPHLPLITNYRTLFDQEGCDECNLEDFRIMDADMQKKLQREQQYAHYDATVTAPAAAEPSSSSHHQVATPPPPPVAASPQPSRKSQKYQPVSSDRYQQPARPPDPSYVERQLEQWQSYPLKMMREPTEETSEVPVRCPIPIASSTPNEGEKVKKEMELRAPSASPSFPIRRWSRMSLIDQEDEEEGEEYRSMASEYLSWLTREERNARKDPVASDSEDDKMIPPLPSTLAPLFTWGAGIVVGEEKKTTVNTVPKEKKENQPAAPIIVPFGRILPTFGQTRPR